MVPIYEKMESIILNVVVMRSLIVSLDKLGTVVAWYKEDFSYFCKLENISFCPEKEKLVILTPRSGFTKKLFVFKVIWEEEKVEIWKYPDLATQPTKFSKHILPCPKIQPNTFTVTLQCKNSIVIEYWTSMRDYSIEVFTQDTVQQAWELLQLSWPKRVIFNEGVPTTEPLLILDRFLFIDGNDKPYCCLLYTSPSPRDRQKSRMPSSA